MQDKNKTPKELYRVGQILNIGYYGGFHNQTLIKAKAEIVRIENEFIQIRIFLPDGGTRKMFGYAKDLKRLEKNYFLSDA